MEGVDEEMSNEVDKRIIEMEFKNEEFEKRASKTMDTLDRIKAKLNSGYSTKAAESLNTTIKSVDFSPITRGIDTVQLQFNALHIAGKRVVENLVDSAMSGIRQVTGKLTNVYNMIKQGGSNRAQNIEQAKFMLKGFNIAWEDIEGDISYGVQDTAYGLDAAAKVASQLVASSVSLGEDMKTALRGISGVAAMTNSTYEDIGRIYTQVAGQGRLMGDQLLQLSGRGLNAAATLSKALGKTEAEIRDMTSKGQIDFMTFARAMNEAFGEHAKEANNTFSGAMSNVRAALSRIGADIAATRFETIRQILVKIIPQLKTLKTAMKPIETGINSATEAVGKFIEYLVDRINVAAIVESVTPKITRITDTIKEFANTAKDYIKDLDNTRPGKFIKNVEKAADTITKITNATEKEIELAKRIWEVGDLGNGEERVAKITELGESYERVQAIVEAFIDSNYDWDKVIGKTTESLEKSGEAANEFIGPINSTKKPTTIYLIVDALYNLSRVIKNVVGSAINIISVVKDTFKEVFTPRGMAGQINTFAGILADISDRLYITRGDVEQFKPLLTFIFTTIKGLAKLMLTLAKWSLTAANKLAQIFNSIRNSKVVTTILDTIGICLRVIIDRMKSVFNYLKDSGVLNKFVNILKYIGLLIGEKIVNAFIFLANISGDVFVAIGNGFGFVVDKVGDLIVKIEEAGGLFQVIKDFFTKGVDIGSTWVSKIADKFASLFSGGGSSDEEKDSIFKKAYDKAAAFGRGLIEGINSITFEDLKNAGGLVAKIATVINLLQLVSSMTGVNKAVSGFFKSMKGFFDGLSNLTASMAHRNNAAAIESLARSIGIIVLSIVGLTYLLSKSPNSENALNKAVEIVSHFVLLIGMFEIILAAINKTKAAANARKLSITLNARRLAMATIFASIATFVWTISKSTKDMTEGMVNEEDGAYTTALRKSLLIMGVSLAAVVSAAILLVRIADGLKNPAQTAKNLEAMAKIIKSISGAVLKISINIALLTAIFTLIEDDEALDRAMRVFKWSIISIIALMALGTLLAKSLSKSDKKADSLDLITNFIIMITGSITALMASIAILAYIFSKVPIVTAMAAGAAFIAVVGTLMGVMFAVNEIKIKDIAEFNTKMKALQTIGATIGIIIASIGALAVSLGAMNSMGVSIKELFYIIVTIAGMITLIVGIGGLVASIPGVNVGLSALGAALSGFGIAMAGVAINILGLALAFKIIIDTLPKVVGALVSFEEQVQGKKDIVVSAIADFIGILAEGLLVGFLKAVNILIDKTEVIAEAIIDTIIVLCNALGKLLKTKSGPIVDALANLIEGVVVLLKDVIVKLIEEAIKGVKWLIDAVKQAIGGTENYEYSEATVLDTQAEQSALYINSDKINAKTKEAHRRWLKMNGYDENGQRTEEWTGTTVITIDQSLKYNDASSSDFYNTYYSNTTERGAVLDKTAKEEKENSKSLSSIAGGLKNEIGITNDMSFDASKLTENLGDVTGKLTDGFSSLTDLPNSFNEDMLNETSLDNLSDVISDEAEETAESFEDYETVVNDKTNVLSKAIQNMVDTISASLESLGPKAKKYGIATIDGFVEGLTIMSSIIKLTRASTTVAKTVKNSMAEALDIHSPSRVMHTLGEYTIIGFANGLTDTIKAVKASSSAVGQASVDSMRDTLKSLNELSIEGIDTSPRITPILDLSNVTSGMTSLDSMFNNSRNLRLASVASGEARRSASARLSAIYQNESNFDDSNTVNAIGSLQEEISTIKDAISGMQVVMDSRALVGQIATPMDKALGKRALAGRRTK